MEIRSADVLREPTANVALRGARVTKSFRDNLFDAANRAGMSPNEFCLFAAAKQLQLSGHHFTGLFRPGDIDAGSRA